MVGGLLFLPAGQAVVGIGEPNSPVGLHDHVIGRVQLLSVVGFDEAHHRAVLLGSGDAVGAVLGRDEAAFSVERIAVGVVAGRAKGLNAAARVPTLQFVGGDIAEDQETAAAGRHPDGSFGELKAGGDALDLGIRGE